MLGDLIGRTKKRIPLPIRRQLRIGWTVVGRINDLATPRGRQRPWRSFALSVGGGDFDKVGREYLGHFKELGGLEPHHRVLDVGCGIGRMAVPLTTYLDTGTYDGFDIVKESIRWCSNRIGKHHSNFTFKHVDVFNRHYNPRGKLKAWEFSFPYADGSFDFVFLVSVFTHLLPDDMENYLREVARVLDRGGRCLITFTLLNDESLALIESGKSSQKLIHQFDHFRTTEPDEPETLTAYEEDYVRDMYKRCGLEIVEPIHYGFWSGREGRSYQDLVIATKPHE